MSAESPQTKLEAIRAAKAERERVAQEQQEASQERQNKKQELQTRAEVLVAELDGADETMQEAQVAIAETDELLEEDGVLEEETAALLEIKSDAEQKIQQITDLRAELTEVQDQITALTESSDAEAITVETSDDTAGVEQSATEQAVEELMIEGEPATQEQQSDTIEAVEEIQDDSTETSLSETENGEQTEEHEKQMEAKAAVKEMLLSLASDRHTIRFDVARLLDDEEMQKEILEDMKKDLVNSVWKGGLDDKKRAAAIVASNSSISELIGILDKVSDSESIAPSMVIGRIEGGEDNVQDFNQFAPLMPASLQQQGKDIFSFVEHYQGVTAHRKEGEKEKKKKKMEMGEVLPKTMEEIDARIQEKPHFEILIEGISAFKNLYDALQTSDPHIISEALANNSRQITESGNGWRVGRVEELLSAVGRMSEDQQKESFSRLAKEYVKPGIKILENGIKEMQRQEIRQLIGRKIAQKDFVGAKELMDQHMIEENNDHDSTISGILSTPEY